jgi:hypothetical protein
MSNDPFIAGSGAHAHAGPMHRTIAVSAFAAALLSSLPAFAQEVPELEGAPAIFPKATAPPPLKAPPAKAQAPRTSPKPAARPATASPSLKPVQKVQQAAQQQAEQARQEAQQEAQRQAQIQAKAQQAAADKVKTDQAQLDQQAAAQKAEQSRLARLAASLTAREAELSARSAELDAQEQRLAQIAEAGRDAPPPLKVEDDSVDADSRGADNDAVIAPSPRDLPPRRSFAVRLDYDTALRECRRAGEDAAFARRFDSADYVGDPRVVDNEGWELRGRMRLEDRRGYLLVNTVCEVAPDGDVQHFALLR